MAEEVQKYEQIDLVKDPVRILAEAKRAADALTDVIKKKPKPVIINGEQYLEFEDLQTLGRFYGYTVKLEWSRPVIFEGVRGWESRAVVLDRDGKEVSAAEAMCLNDEEKWSSKTKYEYQYILKDGTKQTENPPKDQIMWIPNPNKPGKMMPKKERSKVGDEPVPFFQIRSMSQTRASAKAFRNVLAWIVVLAGYKPTPAEEMTSTEEDIQDAEFTEEKSNGKSPESLETKPSISAKNKFAITQILKVGKIKDSEWYRITGHLDANEQGFLTKDIHLAEKARTEIGGVQFNIEYIPETFVIISMAVNQPKG